MAYVKTVWTNDVTQLNADNLNHIEQGIEDATQAADLSAIIDLIYPVGVFLETVDGDFNPNTAYTGTTWIQCDGGIMLVSAGGTYAVTSNMKDGGDAEVTLTAAQSGMPAHSHGPYAEGYGYMMAKHDVSAGNMESQSGSGRYYPYQTVSDTNLYARPTATGTAAARNATSAHNNMPPYKVVYRWQRTA